MDTAMSRFRLTSSAAIILVLSALMPLNQSLAQGAGVQAIIESLSGEERRELQSMSREEKRAFFRARMGKQGGAGGGARRGKPGRDETTAAQPTGPVVWPGPIIDVHSQVDRRTDLDGIVPLLDQAGVAQVILSTRFNQPSSDVIELARRHPKRIIPAVKTKSRAFMKGHDGFPEDFFKELKSFDYRAMAEIIMWHAAKKGVGAGEAIIDPDDSRIGPVMEAARKGGWPYIAHVEFAAIEWGRSDYMKKFEAFLAANRDVPIGLIHMGQLEAEEAGGLLSRHANLFFITSHTNPVYTRRSRLPWTEMFDGERLTDEWRLLVLKHTDRFVLGFDNVFYFHWEDAFLPGVTFWRKALAKLPDGVAHAIAHGNAERLWKLPPARPVGAWSARSSR